MQFNPGDLVRIVQSESDRLVPVSIGEVGVVIASELVGWVDQDAFSVLIKGRAVLFGSNYLEVISENR